MRRMDTTVMPSKQHATEAVWRLSRNCLKTALMLMLMADIMATRCKRHAVVATKEWSTLCLMKMPMWMHPKGCCGIALQAACQQGYQHIVGILLQNEADVKIQGRHCGNALQAACYWGNETVVEMLLAKDTKDTKDDIWDVRPNVCYCSRHINVTIGFWLRSWRLAPGPTFQAKVSSRSIRPLFLRPSPLLCILVPSNWDLWVFTATPRSSFLAPHKSPNAKYTVNKLSPF
jgi:hypothetical protein